MIMVYFYKTGKGNRQRPFPYSILPLLYYYLIIIILYDHLRLTYLRYFRTVLQVFHGLFSSGFIFWCFYNYFHILSSSIHF